MKNASYRMNVATAFVAALLVVTAAHADDKVAVCFTDYNVVSDTIELSPLGGHPSLTISGKTRAFFSNTKSNGEPQSIDADLVFSGTAGAVVTGSGKVLNQSGFKMLELNPCNLVYVTYRIKPWGDLRDDDQLNIQVKRNVKADGSYMTESSQCLNNGYSTIRQETLTGSIDDGYMETAKPSVHLFAIVDPATQQLCVRMIRDKGTEFNRCVSLTSTTDGAAIAGADWASGNLGVRTDNAQVTFTFNEAFSAKLSNLVTRKYLNSVYWDELCGAH
jgi:hypothetical protein